MTEDTRSERLIIEDLLARIQALEERADAQTRRTETLAVEGDRGEVTALGPATDGPETVSGLDSALMSRRGLLGAAVLGAAGVAGIDAVLHPETAAAGTDGDVVLGAFNTTGSLTSVDTSGSPGTSSFMGASAGYAQSVSGTNADSGGSNGVGVSGSAGSGIGVAGSAQAGTAVSGISTSGYGGFFSGGTAPLRLDIGFPGPPTSGFHEKGEFYFDSNGSLFLCTASGFSGTWVTSLLQGVTNRPAALTTIDTTGNALATSAFEGSSAGFSTGLTGVNTDSGGSGGYGVYGQAQSGTGVLGIGGYGGSFAGSTAPLALAPGGSPGAPASGTHVLGEVYVDINGVFYICTTAGPPGIWMQLGGIGLQSFPNPRRVFHATMISSQVVTSIDATVKQAGGSSGVPAGAHAMYAAVQSDQPGRLTLYPNGTTDPGIANWTNNGTGGILYLSYMLVPLDATGKFSIHSYITGNVYVDAWGYLP